MPGHPLWADSKGGERAVPVRCAREFEVKGKTKERTVYRGQNKILKERKKKQMANLLVLPRPAESLQSGAGFSGKA